MALRHSPKIVTDGLVLALDAANTRSYPGSGSTWFDLSPSSNNGTLQNGVGFNSGNGGYLTFDGVDDMITTQSGIMNPNSNLSFSVWTFFTGTGTQTWLAGSGLDALQVRYISGSDNVQIVDSFRVNVGSFSGATLSTSVWCNVVVTKSSNTYSCYINGEFISSFTSSNVYSAQPDRIGRNRTQEELEGRIAQLTCYNRALSASEVAQNYNALKGRFGL